MDVFIFLLQLREVVFGHAQVYLFTLASGVVWLVWIIKVALSRRYRHWTTPCQLGSSVIVPVVDEDPEEFRRILELIVEQEPSETVVVINGKRQIELEGVCAQFPTIRCLWTEIPGKRNAIAEGLAATREPIVVLVDSDTRWSTYTDEHGLTYRTLPELLKPFSDPTVGGVTTRQRIMHPERCWLTRWADWLENTRALYSMPAQSVLGQVGCLPGRTIAFRREILEACLDDFLSERFLGVFLEVSDDRTLTNHCLKQGYRSVYQYTSLVYTDTPRTLRKLFKQQLRWARGSQYNTLRMLPWMLGHAPALAFFFLIDILLPFTYVGATAGWLYRAKTHTGANFYRPLMSEHPGWRGPVIVIALMIASSWTSALVRQARHLATRPSDAFRLPIFIIACTFLLMPVRIIGFMRMAHAAGWGTRHGAYAGGQGPLSRLPSPQPQRHLEPARQAAGAQAWTSPPPTNDLERILALLDADEVQSSTLIHGPAGTAGIRTEHITGAYITFERRARQRRQRINPLAVIPYLIAVTIFAVEAMLYV